MVTFSVNQLLVGAQRAHLIFFVVFYGYLFKETFEELGYMSFSAFANCSNHFACK